MFYNNTQEMLLRRKLEEQAELEKAIELQGRRLMSLQLPDWKNDRVPHHHRSLSVGAHVPLSPQSHTQINQIVIPFDRIKQEIAEGHSDIPAASFSVTAAVAEQDLQKEDNLAFFHNNDNGKEKEQDSNLEAPDLHKIVEQVLPDILFAAPSNSTGNHQLSESSTAVPDLNDTIITAENNTSSSSSVNSASCMASH